VRAGEPVSAAGAERSGGHVLVVNAGSSSLKLSVLDAADRLVALASVPADRGTTGAATLEDELGRVLTEAGAGAGQGLAAVGHRVVHGGTDLVAPVVVDAGVRHQLEALTDLAPLHQPTSLAALDAVSRLLPDVPAVACFDTAFHATIPPAAATYALPAEWRRRWSLRRFGFHGLSHAYASRRAAALVGRPLGSLRIVTCHLGAGASLAAVSGGVSVDTTMGFTPLDGLVMATRSGSVDPGLVLWLEEHVGMPSAELASALEHRSGLLGLAGSADLRAVLAAEEDGVEDAVLAVAVYLHRLRSGIAAMAAALGGLDALVFTGGVGEGSAAVRARAVDGLAFLGVAVDPEANETTSPDRIIGAPGAPTPTVVVAAREDLEIARGVREALGQSPSDGRAGGW
jgi:acetate kinase